MEEKIETIYRISDIELAVVLALKGVDDYFGFELGELQLEQKDMILVLQNMIKRGIVTSDGTSLIVVEEYDKIIEYVCHATAYLKVHPVSDKYSACLCYLGKKILISSLSVLNNRELRFLYVSYQDIWKYFEESGYLSDDALGCKFELYHAGDKECSHALNIYNDYQNGKLKYIKGDECIVCDYTYEALEKYKLEELI